MLVHRRFPSALPAAEAEEGGPPPGPTASDHVARFLRATKPPARYGAHAGAIGLLWAFRAVLWLNLQVAGIAGIALLYALGKLYTAFNWARYVVPVAVIAVIMVLLKGLYKLALIPVQHISLSLVALCFAVEILLGARVFTQVAYKEDVGGIAGTLLSETDMLVAPFENFEGSPVLHDTGVVEFATLTAMEAYLVLTIGIVISLMFWSEFLHMYRRVRDFFIARSLRRQARAAMQEVEPEPIAAIDTAPSADLSAAS
jgi:hypothetical protein